MIGSAHIQTINAWGECQEHKVPTPIEGDDLFYTVISLTDNSWHWHENIPDGYEEVHRWELEDEVDVEQLGLTFAECPSCENSFPMIDGEAFNLEDPSQEAQYLDILTSHVDRQLYVILLDGAGLVFLQKEDSDD